MKRIQRSIKHLTMAAALSGCADIEEEPEKIVSRTPRPMASVGDIEVDSDWGWGYCARVRVDNDTASPLSDWSVSVHLNESQKFRDWEGIFSGTGSDYTVSQQPGAATIEPGKFHTFGFCAFKTGSNWQPETQSTLSCDDPLSLTWPLKGRDREDWVVNNYVDLDPSSPGVLDYRGGSQSYDDHRALDIDIPSFREMDNDTAGIYAVAGGVVKVLRMGEPDRNVVCSGDANEITITHDNGWVSHYLHLKKDSAFVSNGQVVTVGTKLAIAGSSGCSTQPHLHLEIFGCSEQIDPFQMDLWQDAPDFVAPEYDAPSGYMKTLLLRGRRWPPGPITRRRAVLDPKNNISSLSLGSVLGLGAHFGAGADGVNAEFIVRTPTGGEFQRITGTIAPSRGHHWLTPETDPLAGPTGSWSVEVLMNGETVDYANFEVTP